MFKHRRKPILVFVVLPTLVAAIYFFFLAADRYISEAQFIIRDPASSALGQFSSVASISSSLQASEEVSIVHAYVRSRDAIADLTRDTPLLEALARPKFDMIYRFPAAFVPATREHLYRHTRSLISIRYDNVTGISTLRVEAFAPEDARILSTALLTNAEKLINRLGARSQNDARLAAEEEMAQARSQALSAHQALAEFRAANAMIDPKRIFDVAQETLLELAKVRVATSTQLADLLESAPQNPQIPILQRRLGAIDNQNLVESKRLAGSDRSLGAIIAEYEGLVLKREFAEQSYTTAAASLQAANMDAHRQQLFLELVSSPSTPVKPAYPNRLLSILTVFFISACLYFICCLLFDEVRSHAGR